MNIENLYGYIAVTEEEFNNIKNSIDYRREGYANAIIYEVTGTNTRWGIHVQSGMWAGYWVLEEAYRAK